jgi:hypothetical protein
MRKTTRAEQEQAQQTAPSVVPPSELQVFGPDFFTIDASEQIRMRRIDGWKQICDVLKRFKPDILNQEA